MAEHTTLTEMINRACKTAKDADGKTIRVGDSVLMIDWDNTTQPQRTTVESIHRQGYDGTILTCSIPPDAQYPHHWSITAKRVRRLS